MVYFILFFCLFFHFHCNAWDVKNNPDFKARPLVSTESTASASHFFSQSSAIWVAQKNNSSVRKKSVRRRRSMMVYMDLDKALNLIKAGDYVEGTKKLFLLSRNKHLKKRRMEINFILGKTFLKMGLLHSASFHFVSVIDVGDSSYVRRSLEHLSQIAARLGDKKMLKFAITRDGARKVQGEQRDSLYYQYGKYQAEKKNYKKGLFYLEKIKPSSSFYPKARYRIGLAYAQQRQNRKALLAFNDILSHNLSITDPVRTAALMGKARVYYQSKKWNQAVQYYRQIPKDTSFWHDMLFENSWALLRGGRFRSALNGFQTLHSSYYEDYFQPGSLLLRSIIYMYICKYDEMGKVLDLFRLTYSPVRKKLKNLLKTNRKINYYSLADFQSHSANADSRQMLPHSIARKIQRESDFRSLDNYLKQLEVEKKTIQNLPLSWRMSKAGRYSMRLVTANQKKTGNLINKVIKAHLKSALSQLNHFFNQQDYLKYEMLRGKRQMLSKKIARKSLKDVQIIQKTSRDFFVQNGFEFWPFQGEYWLDELGNYHYVGLQNCR